MVTSPDDRHVPTGTLAVLAQRLGTVWAAPSTWSRVKRQYGWRRPPLRVHPGKPKVGLRTTRADEMWHIDTTVIRLLDGTRASLHAVIDNFSRRILHEPAGGAMYRVAVGAHERHLGIGKGPLARRRQVLEPFLLGARRRQADIHVGVAEDEAVAPREHKLVSKEAGAVQAGPGPSSGL